MPKIAAYTLTWSSSHHVYELYERQMSEPLNIVPDSNFWFTWLTKVSSFAFHGKTGSFTARKEIVQRGDCYWYAYLRIGKKLAKKYLGKPGEMTVAYLEHVAGVLSTERSTAPQTGDTRSAISSPTALDTFSATTLLTSTPTVEQKNTQEPVWNVPIFPTPLIGREQEIAHICSILTQPEIHLLTLLGTGGVGKTRLSVEVATRSREFFADGVCFVALAPISDPELVLPTIAQELGIQQSNSQPLLEQLKAILREQCLLLLLDNVEQVTSATPLVEELVLACPQIKILITSRTVLHLQSEHLFPVPPLELPVLTHLPEREGISQYAAVALFVKRAQALLPTFQLTPANMREIAEICVHLDGLPLAIELAAARIRLLPPQALLARFSKGLDVLSSGIQTLPERQQTLRNTLKWSYDLLDTQEQRLFRRLSVFVGGSTLEAVESICNALNEGVGIREVTILDRVASLIDKSLLLQTEQEGKEPRLQLLETVREYGRECLLASGEMETVRQAHADYYLALAEEAMSEFTGPRQALWLQRLGREHDNLRAVMLWLLEQAEDEGDREVALRLGRALLRFWQVHGLLNEGRNFLKQALAGSKGNRTSLRAKTLLAAANLAIYQGDLNGVELLCEESLALCRELGEIADIAQSLYLLGWTEWQRCNLVASRSLQEEALALFKEVCDEEMVPWSLLHLAIAVTKQGEYVRGRVWFEESVTLHAERANKRGSAWALFHLAWALLLSQDDQAPIHSLIEEAWVLFREVNEKLGIAECYRLSGQVALHQSDTATARSLLREGLALHKKVGYRHGIAESYRLLASVAAMQNDQLAARNLFQESFVLAREADAKIVIASSLEGLAGVVAAQGEPAWAARLLGAAEALREAMGAPIPPIERANYERATFAVRTCLGGKAFAALRVEGRALSPEQALSACGRVKPSLQHSKEQTSTLPAKVPRYPAGLTAREVEILQLVADGLTDAQVAEQLVISHRTVNTHLTSIYNKLGITSRAVATRFAVEHQLV